MHVLNHILGSQEVCLASPRSGATNVHATHGTLAGNHHRTSGPSDQIRAMAYLKAHDICKRSVDGRPPTLSRSRWLSVLRRQMPAQGGHH
jgi:hypothetical protein